MVELHLTYLRATETCIGSFDDIREKERGERTVVCGWYIQEGYAT